MAGGSTSSGSVFERVTKAPVVWITGASAGIGEALARVLAARGGVRLVLSARRVERLEALAAELPVPTRVVPLDLADFDGHDGAVATVIKDFGALDLLIHNAGVSQRSTALETDFAVDRRLVEVDLLGPISLTKAALPLLLENGGGRLVVVSSLVGLFGTPMRSAYSAAKHGLHGFFQSLEAELWDRGLRVTMVCPGFIHTELSYQALTADGSPQASLDRAQAQGLDATTCARRIVRAIDRSQAQVLIGGKEVLMAHVARWAPWLYRRLIRRVAVT